MYDLIVIGGGAAGLTAAKVARGFGKKVAIIEKNRLGGECTWTGCVPSKTLIRSAHVARTIQNCSAYGIATKNIQLDYASILKHVRSVVQEVYQTHTPKHLQAEGIDLYFGVYEFIDTNTIAGNGMKLQAKKYIIATGSSPFVPPIDGLNNVSFLTNQTIFNLETLPESLIILGGGPIGTELASALGSLGVTVTIIERNQRLLTHDDEELVTILQDQLKKEGAQLQFGTTAKRVYSQNGMISVVCSSSNGEEITVTAAQLLVAVGRTANYSDLGLETAGIMYDKKGITVNAFLQTTNKNVFACGDIVGPYQFSHMAYHQAVAAVKNAFLPYKTKLSYDDVIWTTFSDPELATVGLTESDARIRFGSTIRVYSIDYNTIDRAHTDRTLIGRGKFICDRHGKIVGAHILGQNAGEIIHEVQAYKSRGIPLHKLASVIHVYPTYSELIWKASRLAYLDRLTHNPFIKIFLTIKKWWAKQ